MILFCDEDIGTHVPMALRLVNYHTFSMKQKGWLSKEDSEWLTIAGQKKWLAFSGNKKILKVPNERETITREKVGIIFLTSGQEKLPEVLRLLLTKWNKLEFIDETEQRPFAYFLYPNGVLTKQSLHKGEKS